METADTAAPTAPERRDARPAGLVLPGVVVVAFLLFCTAFVPKLTNSHFGDLEFTGWSGPMGSRLLAGDVPYLDYTLPIPPGSFAVLAGIEKIAGGPRLLQELWLNAFIHAALGLLAYAIAVPLTSRVNALLVAGSTLVALTYLNKECAYDHTAQLCTWGSLAVLVRALLAPDAKRRGRLWIVAGALAAVTFAFKQSTAVGAVLSGCVAIGYLAAARAWHRDDLGEVRTDAVRFATGAAIGLAVVCGFLLAVGVTPALYYRAVFLDGAALKGGTFQLVANLWSYVAAYGAYTPSIGLLLAVAYAGARIARSDGGFHLAREPAAAAAKRSELVAVAGVVATFGIAALLLRLRANALEPEVVRWIDWLKHVPGFGLVFGVAFFVAHALRADDRERPPRPSREVGHIFNAVALAALAASLLHNTSAPEFRPFYDNNVIIVVAFLFLFVALGRVRSRLATGLVFALVMLSLFGNKYQRALLAQTAVGSHGHWAGMEVSDRGRHIVEAAVRARALAGPSETVLVLPEDVQLTALIGRPRPPLRGAVVFVDQYPERVLESDLARLERNLPKVIVIHPRQPHQWVRFFRIWSRESPAERLIRHVLMNVLPAHYARDSSYPSKFHGDPGHLDVWVRKP